MIDNKPGLQKIVFIGAGNMAEAIVRGMLGARLLPKESIHITDIDSGRLSHFANTYHVAGSNDNAKAVQGADVVVLCAKPQVLTDAMNGIKESLSPDVLIVSIAAGVTTRTLESFFDEAMRVVRVMPNTPALVGAGAGAFCCGTHATEEDARFVEIMFNSVGMIIRLEEPLMDAVTALSGSGPAYVFYLVEAMLDAAREMGMEQETARALTIATVQGAASMLKETGLEPHELRRRVTSKGGTTQAAIEVFQKADVHKTISAALKAAQVRSAELSR